MRKTASTNAMPKKISLQIAIGDRVLIGTPGTTMPRDWWQAVILWIGPQDILVEQFGFGSNPHRAVYGFEMVRAVGDGLAEFRETCCAEVKQLTGEVKEAERALQAARDAVWRRLDELCARTHVGKSAP